MSTEEQKTLPVDTVQDAEVVEEVDESQLTEEVKEEAKGKGRQSRPLFSSKAVCAAFKKGGKDEVLALFPTAVYSERKEIGFVHF